MMRQLIWKEWREQGWKLPLMCLLLGGFAYVGYRTRIVPDVAVTGMCAFFVAIVLPLFVGMDLFAAERGSGSMASLLRLPVRPWKIFTVKMLGAWLNMTVPAAVAIAVWCLMAMGREGLETYEGLRTLERCYLTGLVLLVWMTGLGIHQPSESRVAVVGIAVMVGSFAIFYAWAVLANLTYSYQSQSAWAPVLDALCSLTPLSLLRPCAPRPDYNLFVQPLLAVAVLLWTVRRFSRITRSAR